MGHVLLRIANLAGGNGGHLETGERVKQEQDRLRKCAGSRTGTQHKRVRVKKEKSDGDEDKHRHQLANGKQITGNRRLSHSQNIDSG